MRLRRSVVSGPGLHRVRRGSGFSYHDQEGKAITDEATLTRIKDLVIPPAWKNVWISPHPNGHIQAVGTDVAGRRQYLYHEKWQQDRAEEKFDRVLEMSKSLPDMRRQINADLESAASNGTASSPWHCNCWTSGTFGPAVSSTRRRTIRSASPRCSVNTWPFGAKPSSSTFPPRAACVAPCSSRTPKWSGQCAR